MLDKDQFPEELRGFFSELPNAEAVWESKCAEIMGSWSNPTETDFLWIKEKSLLPWLKLSLHEPMPVKAMLTEASRLYHMFVPHRSFPDMPKDYRMGNEGWLALTLHGLGSKLTCSPSFYGLNDQADVFFEWTAAALQCPVTSGYLQRFPFDRRLRMRFMLIRPGGYIFPHDDRKDRGLQEVNLAINTPKGFYFWMENHGLVPFEDGNAYILDTSIKHAVVNLSKEPRLHMVLHGDGDDNKAFQEMLVNGFQNFLKEKEL